MYRFFSVVLLSNASLYLLFILIPDILLSSHLSRHRIKSVEIESQTMIKIILKNYRQNKLYVIDAILNLTIVGRRRENHKKENIM